MRLLVILIVIALVIYLVRSALNKPPARAASRRRDGEPMVACTQCKLHIPRSEAVAADGQHFCSDTHLQQWRRDKSGGPHN